MKRQTAIAVLSILMVLVFVGFGFASGDGEKAAAKGATKISLMHQDSIPEGQAYFQRLADEYAAAHPGTTFEITALENESFKSRLATLMQAGTPPDLFNSWGGGVMVEYAKAGLLRDITKEVKGTDWGKSMSAGVLGVYQHEGKQYGLPYDMGAVGFWYNKDLLAKAGYMEFPKTWPEFTAMVTKLKAAGITPIALGGGDKWPAMYYWSYLSMRLGGKAAFDKVFARTGKFTDEPFVKAAQMLLDLSKMNPFQDGFLGATYPEQGGLVGNGIAAVELMGQWAPAVEKDSSTSKAGIGDKLAVAPFPAVPGGVGLNSDAMGGGNGFAVGKSASDAAVDFLKYMTNLKNNTAYAELGRIVPTTVGAEVGLKDPMMKLVKGIVDKSGYYQLYLDQFFPPAVGGTINDSVQGLLAGSMTPQQMTAAIQKAYEEAK